MSVFFFGGLRGYLSKKEWETGKIVRVRPLVRGLTETRKGDGSQQTKRNARKDSLLFFSSHTFSKDSLPRALGGAGIRPSSGLYVRSSFIRTVLVIVHHSPRIPRQTFFIRLS
jgi:hypothetical protein